MIPSYSAFSLVSSSSSSLMHLPTVAAALLIIWKVAGSHIYGICTELDYSISLWCVPLDKVYDICFSHLFFCRFLPFPSPFDPSLRHLCLHLEIEQEFLPQIRRVGYIHFISFHHIGSPLCHIKKEEGHTSSIRSIGGRSK